MDQMKGALAVDAIEAETLSKLKDEVALFLAQRSESDGTTKNKATVKTKSNVRKKIKPPTAQISPVEATVE